MGPLILGWAHAREVVEDFRIDSFIHCVSSAAEASFVIWYIAK